MMIKESLNSQKDANLANDSGGLRPRKTAWCSLKTFTHSGCFHQPLLGSSSDTGSLKWDRLRGYKAVEDEDFQKEHSATAVSRLQLSPSPSSHPHLPCASDQPHLRCLSDGLHRLLVCNQNSYLSCSAWESLCQNVAHVLMFWSCPEFSSIVIFWLLDWLSEPETLLVYLTERLPVMCSCPGIKQEVSLQSCT